MVLPTSPTPSSQGGETDELLQDMMDEERYYATLRSQMAAASEDAPEPSTDTAGLTLPKLRSI